jgi:hypothetical protein
MHRMDDDIAAVFSGREDAVEAVDELRPSGLANDFLVRSVRSGLSVACDVDTDKAVLRAVARGVAFGIPGGMAVGVILVWAGSLVAGANPEVFKILVAGGFGGFAAGVFFGFVAGAVATQKLLYEEERWGDVYLAEGEVLVVVSPSTDGQTVRETLRRHGGRPVDAPPHHELAA